MPFSSGVHVACLLVGGRYGQASGGALAGRLVFSQTMSSSGITSQGAPDVDEMYGVPTFEIFSAVDVWVAVAKSPDATNGPRILVKSGESRNLICVPGDKLAWVAA